MIKGKYVYFDGEERKFAFEIRKTVFKGTNLPDRDDADDYSVHGLVYDSENNPIATGRITAFNGKFTLSRVAVLPQCQRQKYGDFMVRMLVDKAFLSEATEVFVDCPENIIPFFEQLRFKKIGEEFEKNGINYIPMSLKVDDFYTGCGHKVCSNLK